MPLEPPRQPLSGNSHADLVGPLERLPGELGYTVELRPLAGRDGLCGHSRRRIPIDDGLEVNDQVKTLIHELAHALMHLTDPDGPELSYAEEEVVVESIAFNVVGRPRDRHLRILDPVPGLLELGRRRYGDRRGLR